MLVADRYNEYLDRTTMYTEDRSRRSSYFDRDSYDDRYEADRRGTSDEERERLMESLERRGTHRRVERRDESRYSYYVATETPAQNNYDRLLDRRAAQGTPKEKKVFNKKKLPFIVAYLVFALAAVIAVTLSVVGISKTEEEPVAMNVVATNLEASAEEPTLTENLSAAVEEVPVEKKGGEMYVKLKSGELVAVEVPEITEVTVEEENWFDKVCTWFNGIFGGN